MKTIKYLFMGALMTVFSGSAMAQTSVNDAVNAIKTNKDKAAVASIVKATVKEDKKTRRLLQPLAVLILMLRIQQAHASMLTCQLPLQTR